MHPPLYHLHHEAAHSYCHLDLSGSTGTKKGDRRGVAGVVVSVVCSGIDHIIQSLLLQVEKLRTREGKGIV